MTSTIVLNQSNIVGSDNNVFVYNFPNSVEFPNHEIAVQSVNMYYSWFNISKALNNNTFTFSWKYSVYSLITKTFTSSYPVITITLPDGLYEISDINNYFQYEMKYNGMYLINSSGENEYFAEWILNPTAYSVQLNLFPVPTTLPAGYTQPNGFIGYPNSTECPLVKIPNDFYKIVGFAKNFSFGNSNKSQSQLSITSPQVQPNPTLLFSLSNISNKYSNPSSIVYAISPTVAFGEQMVDRPPQFAFNQLLKGTYNQIRLSILGTNLQPVKIIDPNMTICLIIRSRKDITDDLVSALNGSK